ncbi:MAG: zinc metallopeptidase [Lentisphaeria bacterium]|nr:zinc metallopeptidase [Lentisphaeria bacterium]
MFFDPVYLLFTLPGILLGLWASAKTKFTFDKYSRVASATRVTGAEAAVRLLSNAGIRDVRVEETQGFLSDHYDPSAKVLRLSPGVYRSDSIAAIGVACHEAGHAIQHATGYAALGLRSALVPAVNLASPGAYIFFVLGLFMHSPALVVLGIVCFGLAVLFSLVTLPVEYDASMRAKKLMVSSGIVTQSEAKGAGEVLSAAFLTYVAAAVTALLTLLYFLFRSGLLGRRD